MIKMKKILIGTGNLFILTSVLLYAWIGTTFLVEITYPVDRSTITAPITFMGNIWNDDQDIDYYILEYWKDTNNNWTADSGDTDSSWTFLEKVDKLEVVHSNNISSYEKGSKTIFQPNNQYLVRCYAVDFNGYTSSDTSIVYISDKGDDNTWTDSEIVSFRIKTGTTPPRPGGRR